MTESAIANADDEDPPHVVLHPLGEIDAYGAGVLRRSWADVDEGKDVVVVLDDLPFMDSAGVGALVAGVRRARQSDAAVVVVTRGRAHARLFETAGLAQVVPLVGSYAEALDLLRRSGR